MARNTYRPSECPLCQEHSREENPVLLRPRQIAVGPTLRNVSIRRGLLFAISPRCAGIGVNHPDFQIDSAQELGALHSRLETADRAWSRKRCHLLLREVNKYWVTDPPARQQVSEMYSPWRRERQSA